MEFSGTESIEGASAEEAWLALSDPVMIKQALPGCQFLVALEEGENPDFDQLDARWPDEDPETLPAAEPEDVAERAFEEGKRYAARMQISVGNVSPTFDTVVTIDEREFPKMTASGQGDATSSSFEMQSQMELIETDEGVNIQWESEADVFGRIAQLGQRMLNPVANRVVGRFFSQVESEMQDLTDDSDGSLRERVSNLF
ncbi:SRPBCC domain-containing protein [Halobacteria archaeon AArc-dxtr1]|nr:SRPBCC domain-containing protein [Halobacteria archaeon AArc-dxtr1]